jgi:guanylate kinase
MAISESESITHAATLPQPDTPQGKLIVFAAPSGTGKSTIAKAILAAFPNISFSVSATTRPIREGEQNGREYYFLSKPEFEEKLQRGEFIEYSKHFDNYYGTLKSVAERTLSSGKHLLLDLDVHGSMTVKKLYGSRALLIFIKPPSLEVLRTRLMSRRTETPEAIQRRLERAEYELSFCNQFDAVVVNDSLQTAIDEVKLLISQFITETHN